MTMGSNMTDGIIRLLLKFGGFYKMEEELGKNGEMREKDGNFGRERNMKEMREKPIRII